jgi:cytochrome P450
MPLNLLRVRRDPIAYLLEVVRRHGDVAFFEVGPFRVYLLSHPDHVRDVLVVNHRKFRKGQGLQEARRILGDGLLTSEGDLHRRQRRLINPVFHHDRVAGYGEAMAAHAEARASLWREGQVLDVHREMMALTLAIVGKTLFGAEVGEEAARRVGVALSGALDTFNRFFLPFQRVLDRLPLPSNRRLAEARRTVDEVVYGMIRERRGSGDRGDLLALLMAAEEEGGGTMTDGQVRDEAVTLFLAGHETTANALAWTWYLLSQHPEAEARVHAEVDRVVGDALPTVADLAALEYTGRVVAEALRLYPPSWAIGRRAVEDHQVGGYPVPAGSLCILSPYVVHHDPRWFPDPWGFDPDRWTPEAVARRPRHAYFPFGAGPRMCIGEEFAWMEMKLVVATLARRWRLRLAPGARVALRPQITLRPRYGMPMVAERRPPAPR